METAAKAIAIIDARRNFIDPPSKVNFVDSDLVTGESSEHRNYSAKSLTPQKRAVETRVLKRTRRRSRI